MKAQSSGKTTEKATTTGKTMKKKSYITESRRGKRKTLLIGAEISGGIRTEGPEDPAFQVESKGVRGTLEYLPRGKKKEVGGLERAIQWQQWLLETGTDTKKGWTQKSIVMDSSRQNWFKGGGFYLKLERWGFDGRGEAGMGRPGPGVGKTMNNQKLGFN